MDNQREMHDNGGQGWKCCECGGQIDKLPFEPRDDSNLKCFDCHKKSQGAAAPRRDDREMHDNGGQGWPCADCGGNIDKLPFEPRDTSNLKCRDCFRK